MTTTSLAQNETIEQIMSAFNSDADAPDYGKPIGWVSDYGNRKLEANSGITNVMISANKTEEFYIPLYIHMLTFH